MSKTTWVKVVLFLYAAFMLIFGAYGTFMAREMNSLIGGGAVALVITVLTLWSYKNPRAAYIFALVILLAVMGRFVPNWLNKGFYPGGIISLATILTAGCLVAGHLMAMSAKKKEAAQS